MAAGKSDWESEKGTEDSPDSEVKRKAPRESCEYPVIDNRPKISAKRRISVSGTADMSVFLRKLAQFCKARTDCEEIA